VFLTAEPDMIPRAFLHSLKHYKVLHDRVVFLTVQLCEVPWVPEEERVKCSPIEHGCFRVIVRYGFMDRPDLITALEGCRDSGLAFNLMETSFFVSREKIIPTAGSAGGGMALWRDRLFATMATNAGSFTEFFNIPSNCVVELGSRVEI
jgi:KUP system potassium uptake protein